MTNAPPLERRATAGRGVVVGALALVVGVAVAAVVGSVVDTAESRFSGSTDNRGSLFEAGEVRLELANDPADRSLERSELSISASNLLPGQTIQRCVNVGYRGNVGDIDLRLYGRADGGTGLERFLESVIEVGTGDDPGCADFSAPSSDPVRWVGSLSELDIGVGSYANGIRVLESGAEMVEATVRIGVTLADDDRAQGLSTAFWLVFEVRP
ncbi:MAG: hypothetical protein AB8G26_08005 [Ilumatobacter sp.]